MESLSDLKIFILIPLLKTLHQLIEDSNRDVKVVLLKRIKVIFKAFDQEQNDDEDYIDRAKLKCKNFVCCLFLLLTNCDSDPNPHQGIFGQYIYGKIYLYN